MDDARHLKYTGVSNKLILENLRFLHNKGAQIILRFPVITGINDSEDHLEKLTHFLKKETPGLRKIDLLPYHALASNKYLKFNLPNLMKDVKEPGKEAMRQLKSRFEKEGFEVKIGG